MGCLMSWPAPNKIDTEAKAARVGNRNNETTTLRALPSARANDNCDYATTEQEQQRSSIVLAGNINQTTAAATATATANDFSGGDPIDLARQEREERQTAVPSDDRGRVGMADRLSRKRARQTRQGRDTGAEKTGGSFLAMLVQGRRQSGARIEAAKSSSASSNDGESEPSETGACFVSTSNRIASGKRKLNGTAREPESGGGQAARGPISMAQESGAIKTDEFAAPASSETNAPEFQAETQDDALLFTSVQQLCYEILNRKLWQDIRWRGQDERAHQPDLMCLFVFGRAGSSKGELSFELVQHSSLIGALSERAELERACREAQEDTACPLFHYVDVSALIVANIDDRIREYNKLVARTLRGRRRQLALVATRQESDELDEERDQTERAAEVGASQQESSFDSQQTESSIGLGPTKPQGGQPDSRAQVEDERQSRGEQEAAGRDDSRRSSLEHQFGIMTLSTKQRSILQLKLMKYATCVTSKWIIILIKQEINKLERRLRESLAPNGPKAPRRVYLINLIPNQLSLFRACLYLEQELSLGDIHWPHYATKFERRTNIRVLKEVRREKRSQEEASQTSRSFHFKLSQIRIPILAPLNKSSSHESLIGARLSGGEQASSSSGPAAVSMSSELLANSVNEKLGPKFNERFAQQFKSCNRLLEIRFNPLKCADLNSSPSRSHLTNELESERHRNRLSCFQQLLEPNELQVCASPACQMQPPLLGSSPGGSGSSPLLAHQMGSQSASFDRLDLLPVSGENKRDLPSSSSMVELKRIGAAARANVHTTKWAIELELIKSAPNDQGGYQWQRRLSSKENSVEEKESQQQQQQQQANELHTYEAPRPSSRSPLGFVASDRYHQLLNTSGHSSNSYSLTPTRVAYANGTSQLILEARRVHKRALKLRSSNDLGKLQKLIARARRQLLADLEGWLAAAILTEPTGGKHCDSMGHLHASVGSSLQRGQHDALASRRQPSLVTHTIRVDLSEFECENTTKRPGQAQLKAAVEEVGAGLGRPHSARAASAGDTLRPSLKMRPASSMGNEELTSEPDQKRQPGSARKRHVQFQIEPAEAELVWGASCGPIQRRVWVNECLFASCNESRWLDAMSSFVEMLRATR